MGALNFLRFLLIRDKPGSNHVSSNFYISFNFNLLGFLKYLFVFYFSVLSDNCLESSELPSGAVHRPPEEGSLCHQDACQGRDSQGRAELDDDEVCTTGWGSCARVDCGGVRGSATRSQPEGRTAGLWQEVVTEQYGKDGQGKRGVVELMAFSRSL